MIRQLARFGVVGIAAMAVHWLVVAVLVPLGALPLIANVVAFAIAFNVSYIGHRHWTFAADSAVDVVADDRGTPFKRFFGVALLSFVLNEILYYLLLRYTTLDYRIALLIVLIAVAALTFILSRYWAFRRA
ncbi:MAG TPA: GtrA family protein [Spongiibacteraceae bacterium]|nr:GtrA family protein [Spongiibacteraceae bacterium]